jgi:hypothetical protein
VGPLHRASSVCGWRRLLQIRRVVENVLSKQSRTAKMGGLPACMLGGGGGGGVKNSKKIAFLI